MEGITARGGQLINQSNYAESQRVSGHCLLSR